MLKKWLSVLLGSVSPKNVHEFDGVLRNIDYLIDNFKYTPIYHADMMIPVMFDNITIYTMYLDRLHHDAMMDKHFSSQIVKNADKTVSFRRWLADADGFVIVDGHNAFLDFLTTARQITVFVIENNTKSDTVNKNLFAIRCEDYIRSIDKTLMTVMSLDS